MTFSISHNINPNPIHNALTLRFFSHLFYMLMLFTYLSIQTRTYLTCYYVFNIIFCRNHKHSIKHENREKSIIRLFGKFACLTLICYVNGQYFMLLEDYTKGYFKIKNNNKWNSCLLVYALIAR